MCHLTTDSLTGLSNRDDFIRRLTRNPANPRLTVGILDVFGFRELNCVLGEHAGDTVLRTCGERLRRAFRDGDVVARVGDDEFAVAVSHDTALDPDLFAERIAAVLANAVPLAGRDVRIGWNIGVATGQQGIEPERLLARAAMAVSMAKPSGRNVHAFYDEAASERLAQAHQVANDLVDGLDGDSLIVAYQPQHTVDTLQITGIEALARWRDRDGQVRSPRHFLSAAETLGLTHRIDEIMLAHVARDVTTWRRAGLSVPPVAVNVSASSLRCKNFPTTLAHFAAAVPDGKVELHETILIDRWNQGLERGLDAIRRSGLRVSLDDFGSGHASFLGIAELKPDEVKLDRNLLAVTRADTCRVAMMDAMCSLGRALGFDIVAEGIETAEQLEIARSLGAPKIQGFLLSRPMTVDAMAACLSDARQTDCHRRRG